MKRRKNSTQTKEVSTNASEDINKTVNSETLWRPNALFSISLDDDKSNLNSDDGAKTSKKRAFLVHPILTENERFQ
jgi:hypothetical protein